MVACSLMNRSEFQMFDPQLGDWRSFVISIVENRIASMVKHGKYLDRIGLTEFVSLSEAATDEDGQQVELADQMSPDNQGKILGAYKRRDTEQFSITHDLELALPLLSPEQQETCATLKRVSVKTLARRRGYSRFKLRSELADIRDKLDRKGISEF